MVNQQLVEYVKQQLGVGVALEVVQQALREAGWPAADVDEAVKAAAGTVEAKSGGAPVARDVVIAGVGAAFDDSEAVFKPSATANVKPVTPAATPTTAPATVATATPANGGLRSPLGAWKRFIIPGVLGIAVVVLAVLLFMATRSGGDAKVQRDQIVAERDSLTVQVASLNKAKTDLEGQVKTLTDDNQELLNELSIFTNPRLLGATSTEQLPVDIAGTLTGSTTTQYFITTKRGVVLYVKNYKDPAVGAALAPLVGTTVKLGGTHAVESRDVTVTSVNGQAIAAAPTVASSTVSTATSTPPALPAAPTSTPTSTPPAVR